MPLYIRTRDNVVLRFENIQNVHQWVNDGKITMQAVFLTDDKVWKPIAELLKKKPSPINADREAEPRSMEAEPRSMEAGPRSISMQSNVDGEPAWTSKAKVPLPVSEFDKDFDDDFDDDLDFQEGGSKKGLFIAGFIFLLAGVAIVGYILFGDKLLNKKKKTKTAVPGQSVIAKKTKPVKPMSKKRIIPAEPAKTVPIAVVTKTDAVVHSVKSPSKDKIDQTTKAVAVKATAPTETGKKQVQPKKTSRLVPKSGKKPKKSVLRAKSNKKRPRMHIPNRKNQNTYDNHMTLGNRLLIAGKAKSAEGHFQYALSSNPHSVEALTKIGDCEVLLGNLKKASEYFHNALSLNKEYSPAMLALARLYKKQGNRPQAAAYYSRYVEMHPYGLHVREAKVFLGIKQD